MFKLKRVYDSPSEEDGYRVLVDRLWPRGLSREAAALDRWMRELSPSDGLRRWFDHDPERWTEFCNRYSQELENNAEAITFLLEKSREQRVTLLYAAKDTEHNNAVALKDYLARLIDGR